MDRDTILRVFILGAVVGVGATLLYMWYSRKRKIEEVRKLLEEGMIP